MHKQESNLAADINRIAAEPPPPAAVMPLVDIATDKELSLKPAEYAKYTGRRIREVLQSQIDELRIEKRQSAEELVRLRKIEVHYARFVASNRYLRLAAFVVSAVVIFGGCLISQFAASADAYSRLRLGIGWGLVLCGLLIQLFFALFDPRER